MGVDAMIEGVDLVNTGSPPKLEQNHENATYESWCRKDDAEVDWSKPVQDVYNLIRGTNPQPGAWTTFQGNELKIFDSSMIDADGIPGSIINTSNEGIVVGADGGGILIKRVRPHDAGKITAHEFIENRGLAVGTHFGSWTIYNI